REKASRHRENPGDKGSDGHSIDSPRWVRNRGRRLEEGDRRRHQYCAHQHRAADCLETWHGGGTSCTRGRSRSLQDTAVGCCLRAAGRYFTVETLYESDPLTGAELPYQRRTRSARSVFQRLALPSSVSISNGIYSG